MSDAICIEKWIKETALPYWAKAAIDPAGGVYEYLSMDGTPINDIHRRVRVQARYAYVYAHAAALEWYDGAKEVSDHAWKYLLGPGCQGGTDIVGDGFKGCAHLLNPDGSLHDGLRDTYAQAFIILAGAWRYRAFHDENALHIAKQTLAFLDAHVKADNGGWLEGLPSSLPRRQNPHMHMFEALIALYDATQNNEYLDRATEVYDLCKSHFFDSKSGFLLEYFDNEWKPLDGGGPIEPGHMMEWCWLLREYGNRSGQNVDKYANTLYRTALDIGFDDRIGLLYDKVELDASVPDPSFRIWPQLEFLKASIAQAKSGISKMDEKISKIIDILFDTYLNVPIDGGWADQLNRYGQIQSGNMTTSTFYHLMCAVVEVREYRLNQK